MLTSNFSEIIQVIKNKHETKTIHMLSAEEIGNITLMLRGYLGLVKSGFKTPGDSSSDSDKYYDHLKGLLTQLIAVQDLKLKHLEQSLFDNLLAELNVIVKNIDLLPQIINLKSVKHKKILVEFSAMKDELYKKLSSSIDESLFGFIEAMRILMELSKQMKEHLIKLTNEINELSFYLEQFNKTINTCLKKMTHGFGLEKDNQQCRSFVVGSEIVDFLMNSKP